MEQGAHPASSNARRLGSTLVFRAPMVTVEEAEPSWHALDCGGALQVTAYIEDCERKRRINGHPVMYVDGWETVDRSREF
eukprot:gene6910-biopygen16476